MGKDTCLNLDGKDQATLATCSPFPERLKREYRSVVTHLSCTIICFEKY